jgi:hypothetical protein
MHPESSGNVQVPIGHEDSSAGSPEDAKFESSREIIIGPAVDAGVGATRRRMDGAAGGCEIRGNSEIHQPVSAEGARIWGNPETHRRYSRKMQESGQPDDSSSVLLEERRFGATWKFGSGMPKDARFEETRRSIAGSAGRCRSRGHSEPH